MTLPVFAPRPVAAACLAIGMTLSLAAAAFGLAAPAVVGTVAAVLNEVRIKALGMGQLRPAAIRQRLALGDQVQTGARSHMQALLLDRSAFTVGPNSRLTIDRFVYDPSGGSFSATVAKGALRFISGGRGGAGGRSIATPVATIGIRGTIVDAVVGENAIAIARGEREVGASAGGDPATASLIVLRGPGPRAQGEVTPGAITVTAAGRSIDLDRPMQAVYVPGPGAAPIGPFELSLPGQARINDLILPPVAARPTETMPYPQPPSSDRYRRRYPPPGLIDGPDQPARGPDVANPRIPIIIPEEHDQAPGGGNDDPPVD